MVDDEELPTRLSKFVLDWIETNQTNGSSLYRSAGLPMSLFGQLKQGTIHTTSTLRKLAKAMGVPERTLFELAGYVRADELEPEEFDIADPEVARFFRRGEWGELSEEEREVVRQAIRMARSIKEARTEYQAGAE